MVDTDTREPTPSVLVPSRSVPTSLSVSEVHLQNAEASTNSSMSAALPSSDNVHRMVATVHVSGPSDEMLLKCHFPGCEEQSFGRWAEFTRHYNGAHAVKLTKYWCPQAGCTRSEAGGNRPFPRKDKRDEHVRKMHPS